MIRRTLKSSEEQRNDKDHIQDKVKTVMYNTQIYLQKHFESL